MLPVGDTIASQETFPYPTEWLVLAVTKSRESDSTNDRPPWDRQDVGKIEFSLDLFHNLHSANGLALS
jgi:hypothetical protein